MRKIEDIYFIDKNNAPQPHTIIENTSFKQNGYRITHFSMGANTAGSPERYHHIGIYTCNTGTLHLKYYIDRNSYEEIVLKPGDFWIRPAHTLVSWYAEEDTVFTVLSMRYTANFCEGNMLGKTMSINHLIDKKNLIFLRKTCER